MQFPHLRQYRQGKRLRLCKGKCPLIGLSGAEAGDKRQAAPGPGCESRWDKRAILLVKTADGDRRTARASSSLLSTEVHKNPPSDRVAEGAGDLHFDASSIGPGNDVSLLETGAIVSLQSIASPVAVRS